MRFKVFWRLVVWCLLRSPSKWKVFSWWTAVKIEDGSVPLSWTGIHWWTTGFNNGTSESLITTEMKVRIVLTKQNTLSLREHYFEGLLSDLFSYSKWIRLNLSWKLTNPFHANVSSYFNAFQNSPSFTAEYCHTLKKVGTMK